LTTDAQFRIFFFDQTPLGFSRRRQLFFQRPITGLGSRLLHE
jgi:hypothetical protein